MNGLVLWLIGFALLFIILVVVVWLCSKASDKLDIQKVRAMTDEKIILKVADRIEYENKDGNEVIYTYEMSQETGFKTAPKVVLERCYLNKVHHRTHTFRDGGDIERAMEARIKVIGNTHHKIIRNWKQTRTLSKKQ